MGMSNVTSSPQSKEPISMNGNNSPALLVLRENADPGGALLILPGVLLTTMWVTFISFLSNYFLELLWGCQRSKSRVLHPAWPRPCL